MDVEKKQRKAIKTLDDAPKVPTLLFWLHDAFWTLSSSRPMGMEVGSILYTEIEAYTRLFDIERPTFFASVIRELDLIFIDAQRKRKDTPKQNGAAGRTKHRP